MSQLTLRLQSVICVCVVDKATTGFLPYKTLELTRKATDVLNVILDFFLKCMCIDRSDGITATL